MSIEGIIKGEVMAMDEDVLLFGDGDVPHLPLAMVHSFMAGIGAMKRGLTTRWYDHMALGRKVHRGVRLMQAHETLDHRRCV
ncbi:MAG TPA: hypothetical protein VKF36_24105 [Syntrophorhabdales bacterium]|nr:hypothetical protein [Syntrophorhabdales bacterium]